MNNTDDANNPTTSNPISNSNAVNESPYLTPPRQPLTKQKAERNFNFKMEAVAASTINKKSDSDDDSDEETFLQSALSHCILTRQRREMDVSTKTPETPFRDSTIQADAINPTTSHPIPNNKAVTENPYLTPPRHPLTKQKAGRNFNFKMEAVAASTINKKVFTSDSDDDSDEETSVQSALSHFILARQRGEIDASAKTPETSLRDSTITENNFTATHCSHEIQSSTNTSSTASSPDSTISTTVSTDSPQSDGSLLGLNEHHVIDLPSIALPSHTDRIVKNYELRMMANLPENNSPNRAKFKRTTIITPDGLYQLNQEIKQFKQLLDVYELHAITTLYNHAHEATEPAGILIYDELTLQQLNLLEQKIRAKRGFTVIGYSINEEVFLKLIGLGLYEYPPTQDSYPKTVLNFINTPIARDVTVALRGTVQSYILFDFLMNAYFQFDHQNQEVYNNIFFTNAEWYLLGMLCMVLIQMALLRTDYLSKQGVLSGLNRFRLIEESMIGTAQNWITYTALILPPNVIAYGFIPVLLYGARKGRFDDNELFTLPVINIAQHTKFNTFWNGLAYSLTAGSLCSLGLTYPINSLFFFYKNMNNAAELNKFNQTISTVQYLICALAIFAHLARYPYFSESHQLLGRYSSNAINGLSNSLLDSAASFCMVTMGTTALYGSQPHPNQTGALTMYFGLQILTLIGSFMFTFPTTPNLPEFSIEPNFSEKNDSLLNTYFEKIIKQSNRALLFCSTKTPIKTRLSIELTTSRNFFQFFQTSTVNSPNSPEPINNPLQASPMQPITPGINRA